MFLVTLSKVNISEINVRHLGREKAALGFWLDRIRTLVSLATYSSHRVLMGKIFLAF